MHERTNIRLNATDRSKLEAVASNRNSPQKHVWRARIVPPTTDGQCTAEILRATGKAKTVIWRWQERFRKEGAAGLWRDKTRRSRIPPLSPEITKRVVALTLAGPPPLASHWSGSMAKAAGISVSSVQRIWGAHGLQPHRVRRFKLSNDPRFAAKLHEIVGLYLNPLDQAIVLSVDEKHPDVMKWLEKHRRLSSASPRHPLPGSTLSRASLPSSKKASQARRIPIPAGTQRCHPPLPRVVDHTNANPRPFTWSKNPTKIIAAVRRGHQVLESIH
jgi:hypothetical protein